MTILGRCQQPVPEKHNSVASPSDCTPPNLHSKPRAIVMCNKISGTTILIKHPCLCPSFPSGVCLYHARCTIRRKCPLTPRSNTQSEKHHCGLFIVLVLLRLRCWLILVVLVLLLLFLFAALFLESLLDLLVLFLLQLVPLNIVFVGNGLDLLTQSITVLNQSLPLAQIEIVLLIKLLLSTGYSEVHRRTVADFAVVVQEPHVTANKRRKTNQVLHQC